MTAPVRQITHGPAHHWFGYYDKPQVDPTGRYALGMRVDFEGRRPRPDDVVRLGTIDLTDGDRWTDIGTTTAWCWQQGCMLQWLPGPGHRVIWNDRGETDYVCHILDVTTGERRTLPHAIYCVAPDGRTAFSCDFRRLEYMRPGYGYAGLPDPNRDVREPADTGVFRVDLTTGQRELIVSVADATRFPYPDNPAWFPPGRPEEAHHYFNHLLASPDGRRLIFLHRWWVIPEKRYTRLFTCNADGSDLRPVIDTGLTSHFIWRDPTHILAWCRHPSGRNAFCVFEDTPGGAIDVIDAPHMVRDGHCTYLPDTDWILNDVSTLDPAGDTAEGPATKVDVFLHHVPTGRKVSLGVFPRPPRYSGGEFRVDAHPRHTPDGRHVLIDSAHTGEGRQMFLIDIGDALDRGDT